jgi:hypothetical protein
MARKRSHGWHRVIGGLLTSTALAQVVATSIWWTLVLLFEKCQIAADVSRVRICK